ncbi:50S ribosomal protein L9 [Buchnera aphidicola (Pterocallis alni)]|uniref:50S ribosomal protein L9 n=1 Tax=Buchnera aphidicola TaxID=9 RepID=UPI0034644CAA
MKIILLKNIRGLGKSGSTKIVKSGYARNYLVPTGKAVLANNKNIQDLEYYNKNVYQEYKLKIAKSRLRVLQIKKIHYINIYVSSGENGKLFGSIGSKDIAGEITSIGSIVSKQEIFIKENFIRYIGNYKVVFQPHKEVSCYILVKVRTKK